MSRQLASEIAIPIENESTSTEEPKVRFQYGSSLSLQNNKDPQMKETNLSIFLDNLARQTGLQFKVETRPAEVWFLTEKTGN
jgi:hypothetical protein